MSLATLFQIRETVGECITDIDVMTAAREIAWEYADGDTEKLDRISNLMFKYSTILASLTATKLSHLLMGDEFDKMADEAMQLENMFDQIEGEENNG